MRELVTHTESTLGPVDILVNNAGVMYYTMMKNLQEDEWERQIDINCKVSEMREVRLATYEVYSLVYSV